MYLLGAIGSALRLSTDPTSLDMPQSTTSPEPWLDPICTLVALGILNLYPEGTKISIDPLQPLESDRIQYNYGTFQGATRTLYGKASKDLCLLTLPLFYAVQWINPSDARYKKQLFIVKLAKQALENLRDTYKEKPFEQQYLTAIPLRILNHALDLSSSKEPLKLSDFFLPERESLAIAHSREFWGKDSVLLPSIYASLKYAMARREVDGNADISTTIIAIKASLREVYTETQMKLEAISLAKKAATMPAHLSTLPLTAMEASLPVAAPHTIFTGVAVSTAAASTLSSTSAKPVVLYEAKEVMKSGEEESDDFSWVEGAAPLDTTEGHAVQTLRERADRLSGVEEVEELAPVASDLSISPLISATPISTAPAPPLKGKKKKSSATSEQVKTDTPVAAAGKKGEQRK